VCDPYGLIFPPLRYSKDSNALPDDMTLVQDPNNQENYLFTITKDMKITDLVARLEWIVQRMTVMKGLTL